MTLLLSSYTIPDDGGEGGGRVGKRNVYNTRIKKISFQVTINFAATGLLTGLVAGSNSKIKQRYSLVLGR